jgi:hypothetical protein
MYDSLVIAAFAVWFVMVIQAPAYIKTVFTITGIWKESRKSYRLKPLDCEYCLAFWLGLAYTWSIEGAVIASLSAYILALIINRLR